MSHILRTFGKKLLVLILIISFVTSSSPIVFAQNQDNVPPPASDQTGSVAVDQKDKAPNLQPQIEGYVEVFPQKDVHLTAPETTKSNLENSSTETGESSGRSTDAPLPPSTYLDNGRTGVLPKVQESTGALDFSVPIDLPSGRNGLQPNVNLSYNSQRQEQNSVVGYGWTIDIPYIERINKNGVDKLYSTDHFNSSLSGELVSSGTSSAHYVSQSDDGSFLQYLFTNNSWTVTDKQGKVYRFGMTGGGRMDDVSNTSRVYRWMLEEIRDVNGNYITYTYYKNDGQIYPSVISYTGHGSTTGAFAVEFFRESRPDVNASYAAGFLVKTSYRISKIEVKIDGAWIKKYDLSYSVGSNSVRSLLQSITTTGKDETGGSITLPATVFTYQSATIHWTPDPTRSVPTYLQNGYADLGARFMDLNNDGLIDMTRHNDFNSENGTWFNTGSAWEPSSMVTPLPFSNVFSQDLGSRLPESDGSIKPFFLSSATSTLLSKLWSYDGSSWNTVATSVAPVKFIHDRDGNGVHLQDNAVRVFDVNADGLDDILQAGRDGNKIWLSQGNSWVLSSTTNPVEFIALQYYCCGSTLTYPIDNAVRFADVNADGLTDMLRSVSVGHRTYVESKVWLNTGSGWVLSGIEIPFAFRFDDFSDAGIILADINGDRFPDLVAFGSYGDMTLLGTGNGWANEFSPGLDSRPILKGTMNLVDINGDALVDSVQAYTNIPFNSPVNRIAIHDGVIPDLLSSVVDPGGAKTQVVYKQSTQYKDGSGNLLNPQLPLNVTTVSAIGVYDGLGGAATTTYTYAGGHYYFSGVAQRKLAGFDVVTQTDSVGNVSKTYFHTGNTSNTSQGEHVDSYYKIGRAYRVEQYDNSGNLYNKTINKWDESNIADSSAKFVKLARTTTATYDGNSTHKDKAETYVYDDATGNITQKKNWGEVTAQNDGTFTDAGTDTITTAITYAVPTASSTVRALPSTETTTNHAGVKVAEVRHYYDALALGSVVTGNETKTEQWKSGSSYINSQKMYNQFGLVSSDIDPRGKQTIYTYDAHNIYPITVQKPLGIVMSYEYDYSLGKPKKVTDPNGRVFQTIYDGLDRVVQEKQPDPAAPTNLVVKTSYEYTDTGVPRLVKRSDHLSGSNSIDTYTYLDGLGRAIQTRTETETSSSFAVRDSVYNNRGLLSSESLPYFATGSSWSTPSSNSALFSVYTYDALKRPLSITNAVGVTTNVYDDWRTTVTDPRGKVKALVTDAFGNLVQVDEYDGGNTYTTTYAYNPLGNLTKITDALNNVRNFTYDGLGRRLTAEDLHAVSDSTFGVSSFVYDDAGNVIEKTNPTGAVVQYEYDDLSRITVENETTDPGRDILYQYDTCLNGVGRLCSAGTTDALTEYEYDALGGTTKETVTINPHTTTPFVTRYVYNYQSQPLSITYPDNSQVLYTYNTGGQLESVARKEASSLISSPVVSNFDYSPTGQIMTTQFANGVTTTNTYDPAAMYRLSNKLSARAGVNLQQNAYTYDPNGNITKIVDTSNTATAKTIDFGYDDLNRLTLASTTAATSSPNYKQEFTYNAIGNILTGPFGNYAYAGYTGSLYANPHAMTAATVPGGSVRTFSYDRNGNTLSDGVFTHAWNYRNQLVSSAQGTTTVSAYGYDHTGNRVALTESGVKTLFPNKFFSKGPTSAATTTRHIFAGDLLVATVEIPPTIVIGGGGGDSLSGGEGEGSMFSFIPIEEDPPLFSSPLVYYVHTDHLTGSNVITDAAGSIAETLDYYPYGEIRLDVKAGGYGGEKRKFTGHEYDQGTGLTYMLARFQDGKRGQFLSQDPAFLAVGDRENFKKSYGVALDKFLSDPQQLNSYSYARNNPLIHIDKTGNIIDTILDIGFIGYDLYNLGKAYRNGENTSTHWTSLGLDVGGAFIPGVTGLGLMGRLDDVSKAGKFSSGAVKLLEQTNEAGRVLMEGVENNSILNLIRDNYRATKGELIGSGSATDAMLHTLETGKLVGGSDHVDKIKQNLGRINNLLKDRNLTLNPAESGAVNKILQDSRNALNKLENKK